MNLADRAEELRIRAETLIHLYDSGMRSGDLDYELGQIEDELAFLRSVAKDRLEEARARREARSA